ncbi:hypothetical protein MY4038_009776 [Beauveria bassiana]
MSQQASQQFTRPLADKSICTTSNGAPIDSAEGWQRLGAIGPLLLQDFHLIDTLAHFDRERIPERVVHAKGAGAYGEFVVTHDVTDITSVDMLSEIGKVTKCMVRFSTGGGEKGSPDTARDPRGFSIKMYTSEGNWDWVYNNTPVFFLRDPTNFPRFIHTQKRHPQTNLKDATMFWGYLSTHQESIHQVMHLFSDRGTPYSYRHMSGYSSHTYKWTKQDGSFVYTQVHLKADQGNKTFTNEQASKMASENPDWNTQDLFHAIQDGDFPTWTAYVQILTPEQAEKFRWNIYDLTKVWPQKDVPLRPFGRLILNRNVENYFAETEQLAFSPSHMVPGVEPSVDPVLQSRLFSYPDTQRYRLDVNYNQIPVNCPLNAFNPLQRDGQMNVSGNYGAHPNYTSSLQPLTYKAARPTVTHEAWAGYAVNALFGEVSDEDFVQARGLWAVLGKTAGQQESFVSNLYVLRE